MFQMISASIALAGTAYAAFIDFKTGYIPDELTYVMAAAGFILVFAAYPLDVALLYLGIALAVLLGTLVFYFLGQLGGGDVKLFTALTLLLPVYPAELAVLFGLRPAMPPYPLFLSIFFTAAVTAMFIVSIDYLGKLAADRKSIKQFDSKLLRGGAIALLIVPLFWLWAQINPRMLIFAIPLFSGALVLGFKNDILERYIAKEKPVSELNDDDVLATELMGAETKKALGLGIKKTLLNSEIEEVKKRAKAAGIDKIVVSEYLPRFGPFILLSLVLTLFFGDLMMALLIG